MQLYGTSQLKRHISDTTNNWLHVMPAYEYPACMSWRNISSAPNHVQVLNEHLSLVVGRYIPSKLIRVHNKYKPWINYQCMHAVAQERGSYSVYP